MKKLILIALIGILSTSYSQTKFSKLKVYLQENNLEIFQKNNISPIGGFLKKDDSFIGEFNNDDIAKLKKANIKYEVIISDLQSSYKTKKENTSKSLHSCFNRAIDYPKPEGVGYGSMGGFYTLAEAYAEIDSMKLLFPNIISDKIQIGTSYEGREIYYIKISDNFSTQEAEPQVLYTAIHHSQEPASLQQLIYFMYYLLENYGTNPEVTYLINNTELYFIPIINTDGYVYNEQENPTGGGLHRKNRRTTMFSDGVDLNRNYDWYFGYDETGSSSIGFHPWHRGDNAFSEPETQAVKNFIENHNIKLDVNWHSYGNMIIYPWNYENHYTQDSIFYNALAEKMALQNNYRYGTVYETYGYQSNGDADDWGYGEIGTKNKVLSITAEIGNMDDGFWPAESRIFDLCEQTIWTNLAIAHFSHDYYKLEDLSTNLIGNPNSFLKFNLQSIGLDDVANFNVTFTPLSSNISFPNNTFQYNNIGFLQNITDSVEYNITANSTQDISYVISVNNGLYTFNDTIHKTFGNTTTILSDNCETIANWTGDDWDITNEQSYSGSYSISESPIGNYSWLQTSEIELNTPINLSTAENAVLNFMMKYDLENNYDYVQILASNDDGANWQVMCGRLSKVGTDDEDEGQPVYHGLCPSWSFEEVSLNDFIGDIIKIKFYFYSDQSGSRNGFFFDNLNVTITESTTGSSELFSNNLRVSVSPNPVKDKLLVQTNKNNNTFDVYNSLGQKVYSSFFANKNFSLNVFNWTKGLYYYNIISGNNNSSGKFIVN